MHFRPVSIDDLKLLRHWDEQPHVIACDPSGDWDWEIELKRDPPWREQLVAEDVGRPIGFVQIIDPAVEDSHYWGNVPGNLRAIDIWIGEKNDLGKGFGTQMMHLAISRCFSNDQVRGILIDPLESNTRAQIFYERLGFGFIEQRYFGGESCFVYFLDRKTYFQLFE